MADNKKYYYLKLKENFFDTDEMKILQAMPEGYIYSDILLKLYLKSLKSEGRLMYRDLIPYTPNLISALTNHQIGTVEKAMKIFEQLGLIEILDNGAIYMLDIQTFIGQSSTEADRKRKYRNLVNAEKSMLEEQLERQMSGQTSSKGLDKCPALGQMSDKCPDISPPEIRDKRLDSNNINNNIITARSSDKRTSKQQEEPFITLQLNTGDEYPVYEKDINAWAELYPAVDIRQQLRSMKGWLIANPSKRKTKKGVNRFINNWLTKEQDKGGTRGYIGGKEGYGYESSRSNSQSKGEKAGTGENEDKYQKFFE